MHDYLELWNWDGTLERIHRALYVAMRKEERRREALGDFSHAAGRARSVFSFVL